MATSLSSFGALTVGFGAEGAPAVRHAPSHPDAGLPAENRPLLAYGLEAAHPLNQLHQLLFFAEVQPVEISGALPREIEAKTDVNKPWYFRRRLGSEVDKKLFGGDVRISPLVDWNSNASERLAGLYSQLSDRQAIEQLPPVQRQLLQWDLLSVWWRLEQAPGVPQIDLWRLADLVRLSGQSEEAIRSLPSGWAEARKQFADVKGDASAAEQIERAAYFSSEDVLDPDGNWSEISRKSSQLFVATQSLRTSRVFIKTDPQRELATWLKWHKEAEAREDQRPRSRIETAMVLSIIGITTDLKPVASPLIDEIRFRTVYGADENIDVTETTTQDGSSIWVYFLDRQKSLQLNSPVYRDVPMASQSIFLEYGTAKHATYAAQCSLCHRLTNSGNQTLAGIRSLSLSARGESETDPTYRGRLAETQMQAVTKRLSERLSAKDAELEPLKINFRDAVHSIR